MEHHYHSLAIQEVKRETEDTVTLLLQIPEELRPRFQYKAGQYVEVQLPDGQEKAFSISSSPVEDTFYITLKYADDPALESYLQQHAHAGNRITLSEPEGKYTIPLDEGHERYFYLFAAGSGITPLYSILKDILENEPKSTVHLFYGNRNHENVIFKEPLEALEQKYAGQLIVEYVYSQPDSKPGFLRGLFSKSSQEGKETTGRIDRKTTDRLLKKYPCYASSAEYLICGPGEMISTIMKFLLAQNIGKEHIHVEHFKAHEDHSGDLHATPGHARLIAHLEGERIELPIEDKPVLETLQDAGYDPPFSCQSGACSTCMAKIIEGTVEMEMCYALDDNEIAEGYILTCQSHPTSQVLEITYDV